jgi:hypothetical protein
METGVGIDLDGLLAGTGFTVWHFCDSSVVKNIKEIQNQMEAACIP